jgi:hypothetical protein
MQKREEREEDELVTVLACCTTRVLAQNVFNMLLVTYDIFGIRSPDSSAPASGSVQKKPAAMRPNYQSYRKAKKNRGDGKSPRVELNLPA